MICGHSIRFSTVATPPPQITKHTRRTITTSRTSFRKINEFQTMERVMAVGGAFIFLFNQRASRVFVDEAVRELLSHRYLVTDHFKSINLDGTNKPKPTPTSTSTSSTAAADFVFGEEHRIRPSNKAEKDFRIHALMNTKDLCGPSEVEVQQQHGRQVEMLMFETRQRQEKHESKQKQKDENLQPSSVQWGASLGVRKSAAPLKRAEVEKSPFDGHPKRGRISRTVEGGFDVCCCTNL